MTTTEASADPSYGHTIRLKGVGFQVAKDKTIDALKKEGFGVLTEIDVKETLKKKLDRDFRPYTILGACNPALALQGLETELALGLLLPCNVCVWEEDGGTVVSILRPDMMLAVSLNPALAPMATAADERLRRVLVDLQQ
jgi:uncharacterized protein (DUF302 family)